MGKKDDKQKAPHTGSVAPADAALSTWLHRLWHRGEKPQRIEVYQFFGRKNFVRGEMIHHEDFKPDAKLDVEECNKLANDIVETCQHDCDCTPGSSEMNYLIVVKDNNRTATPLTRRHGPVFKQTQNLDTLREEDNEDDDEEIILGGKALTFKYIVQLLQRLEADKNSVNNVIGELMILLKNRGDEAEKRSDALMDRIMILFDKNQIAEDRKADRDVARQNAEFNLYLKKEGVRTVRNLLPSIFAAAKGEDGPPALPGATSPTNSNGTNGTAQHRDFGPSQERTLLENFMHDIEEAAGSSSPGLDVKLFGDYERGADGKLVEKQKGIFSLEQCRILIGVRGGYLPADELDKLIPKPPGQPTSGLEITPEQIGAAGDAGVSQGMGMALAEIVGLRNLKRQVSQTATTTSTTTEGP